MTLALSLASCDTKPGTGVKGKATDFSLKDLNGNDVRLSDFRGKVVMLDFWATWCPPCVNAIPELAALHEKYNAKGFEIIGASMDHSVRDTKEFVSEHHVPYTIVMSTDKVEKQYGVTTIPVTFLIDKTGKVVKKHLGFAPGIGEQIEKEIRLLIEDMPLDIRGTE
jgi:peroxiredoxin